MANHAEVKTKKTMSKKAIDEIIAFLNATRFKGQLQIEYHEATKEEPGWGPHTWMVKFVSSDGKNEYASRIFWLNDQKSFEIHHGGGGWFAWWIDHSITNAVALEFDGIISDDNGTPERRGDVNKYQDFKQYLDLVMGGRQIEIMESLIRDEMQFVPPEFRY